MSIPADTPATNYEVVIGLEVHAQLHTSSKMFCDCASDYFDAPPNSRVCAVCLGMPGTLPVINSRAVDLTILTGLACGCTIPKYSKFDRKNYPYPDLMKGYQISQFDEPFCVGGTVTIELAGIRREISLERIHLEEDTARLLHRDDDGGYSLLDVNRSGVPLMEIVSAPDMRSPEEAVAYLRKLRQTLRYLGVSDADMEKGSFRADANISLRHPGEPLGSKVEIKNMNSFRSVQRAIEFEIERQAAILDNGGNIDQETRGYIDATGHTSSQRSKEEAHDYRYFPEPDLPPLMVHTARIDRLREQLPELPDAKRERFVHDYGLTPTDARILVETRQRATTFEDTVAASLPTRANAIARWLIGDVAALLNQAGSELELADTRLTVAHIAELVDLVEEGVITGTSAKEVLGITFDSGASPRAIVKERGLGQVRDDAEITRIAAQVVTENPKAVEDYRGGKESAIKFLVGQVMRATRGRTDPNEVQSALRALLE